MKIVVLDRDGVINEDSPAYIKSVAEWHPIPGSLEAIARLCQAGYRVFIASNQSGLGQKLFDYDAFSAINERLQKQLAELGGRIDGIFFAPDHPDQPTEQRKPAPGMLLDLAKRLGANLENISVVGDSLRDLQAAQAVGARAILVRSGNGRKTEAQHADQLQQVRVFDTLAEFVGALLSNPDQRPQTA